MYFEDLSPYYYPVVDEKRLLTIGWLERDHPFPTGDVPRGLVEKLHALERSEYPQQYYCAVTRGYHYCHFCRCEDRPTSDRELLIPNNEQRGIYYSTTLLASHYIEAHGYRPPDAFIRSVLAVDLSQSFDAVVMYDSLLLPREVMRDRYERRARDEEQYSDVDRLKPDLTEKQREHVRRGAHWRYRKWLNENP